MLSCLFICRLLRDLGEGGEHLDGCEDSRGVHGAPVAGKLVQQSLFGGSLYCQGDQPDSEHYLCLQAFEKVSKLQVSHLNHTRLVPDFGLHVQVLHARIPESPSFWILQLHVRS